MDTAERLKGIIKKLEGVYKITVDPKQRERVKKELARLKQELKKVEGESEEVLTEEEEVEEIKKISAEEIQEEASSIEISPEERESFPLLSKVPVEKIHPISDDPEIDMAAAYLKKFEDELWGALSDFHLKLDYNHSRERDKFYDHLENCARLLKDYINILEELSHTDSEKYKERLRLMKVKVGRAFLIAATEFMKEMNDFVNYLIKDYSNKGNIVLNPEDTIRFSKLEGEDKELDGMSVMDALKYVSQFTGEFVEKIKIPEEILSIKKNV